MTPCQNISGAGSSSAIRGWSTSDALNHSRVTLVFEHERIPVDLCCNDPDNGAFAERLVAIEIGANMSFESKQMPDAGPRMRYVVNADPAKRLIRAVAIGGRFFPIDGYKPWQGNWCWDRVWMRGSTVLALLNWPRFRKWFDMDEGEVRLSNWWKAGAEWKDQDIRLIAKVF